MAKKTGRKHPCVVGYQQVAGAEAARQLADRRMVEFSAAAMKHEQPGLSPCHRILGDQFSWQIEVERLDFHPSLPTTSAGHRTSDLGRPTTSAAKLHCSDCMAEKEQPTGTRGIEPAANPLPPTEGAPGEPAPVVVDVDAPVGVRNLPLAVLAVIAVVLLLQYASSVFIPVVIAILISYSLTPSVNAMQKRGVPPAVGAGAGGALLGLSALTTLGL